MIKQKLKESEIRGLPTSPTLAPNINFLNPLAVLLEKSAITYERIPKRLRKASAHVPRRTSSGANRLGGFDDSSVPRSGASKSGSISTPMADIAREGALFSLPSPSLMSILNPKTPPNAKIK